MKRYNRKTLLVNADHTPLRILTWKKAITLIFRGKATQIDFYKNDSLRDGKGNIYPVPAVIILNKYIHRNYQKAPLTKPNLLARDSYRCCYCEKSFRAAELTLDHVIPKSRWKGSTSPTVWTNVVTACQPCNRRKADRTCEASGMYPSKLPTQPSYDEVFLGMNFHRKFEKEWVKYFEVFQSFKVENIVYA